MIGGGRIMARSARDLIHVPCAVRFVKSRGVTRHAGIWLALGYPGFLKLRIRGRSRMLPRFPRRNKSLMTILANEVRGLRSIGDRSRIQHHKDDKKHRAGYE
jgi:hypothetical protein